VYPPLLRHHFGGIFLCGSFFSLGRFIEARVDQKGELGAGGSVATSAWDFARRLGGGQIWIAGLDLSFPELKTHFKGARFEEKSHVESGRFSPAESWNFRALRDGQPFRARRQGGGTVLTDKRLSLYAAWFEHRFSQFPDTRNYSISPGGLEIKGLEYSLPEDFLTLPFRRKEIDILLEEAYAEIDEDFGSAGAKKIREESFEKARNSLLEGLHYIKTLAEDAAEQAGSAALRNRLGHLSNLEQEKALKNLDAANKTIAKSDVKEIAGFLFPETNGWEEEIAAKTQDALGRHLEFSARFYRALADSASLNLLKLGE
jgi:hypothetical protein